MGFGASFGAAMNARTNRDLANERITASREDRDRDNAYRSELMELGKRYETMYGNRPSTETAAPPVGYGSDDPVGDASVVGAANAAAGYGADDPIGDAGAVGAAMAGATTQSAKGRNAKLASDPAEMLNLINQRAAIDIKYGKLDGAGMAKLFEFAKKTREEGYGEAVAKFHAGDIDGGIRLLNSTGQDRGYKLVSFDVGEADINGVKIPTKLVRITDASGREQVIDTAKTGFSMMTMAKQIDAAMNADKARRDNARLDQQDRRLDNADRRADEAARRNNAYIDAQTARARRLNAEATNLEEGLSPSGRDPNSGRGSGSGSGAGGKFTKDHQAVLDDVRREITQAMGDRGLNPNNNERVDNDKSKSAKVWAERLYRYSVERDDPLGPSQLREIVESGTPERGAVVPDANGKYFVVDRIKVTGNDGRPQYFYAGRPRPATNAEVERVLSKDGRMPPAPEPQRNNSSNSRQVTPQMRRGVITTRGFGASM